MVTASENNTIRLWMSQSGKQVVAAQFEGHTNEVTQVHFSPDGQYILTVSLDKTARLWPIFSSSQALIDYASRIIPHQLTSEQRQQFYLD